MRVKIIAYGIFRWGACSQKRGGLLFLRKCREILTQTFWDYTYWLIYPQIFIKEVVRAFYTVETNVLSKNSAFFPVPIRPEISPEPKCWFIVGSGCLSLEGYISSCVTNRSASPWKVKREYQELSIDIL